MKINVDLRNFNKLSRQIQSELAQVPREAHRHFRDITPIRNGNARRRTRLSGNKIVADYGYAGRLDEGASRQAPDGMSEPTIEHIEQNIMPKIIRRLNRG